MSIMLSPHLSANEMACHCCGKLPYSMLVADGTVSLPYQELMRGFEQIRTSIGKPITVNSGYRCPAYNSKIKGAPMSAHLFGLSLDISFDTKDHATTTDEVRLLVDTVNGLISHFRMGVYRGFIHIDTAFIITPRMTPSWVKGARWAGQTE